MAMELDKWVITFVIFGVIVTGSLLLIGDLQTNYNPGMNDSEFSDTYETIQDTYELTNSTRDTLFSSEFSDESALETIVKAAFIAVKQVSNTFTMFVDVLWELAGALGVPSFFIWAAISVMTIAVVYALILLFMRINI